MMRLMPGPDVPAVKFSQIRLAEPTARARRPHRNGRRLFPLQDERLIQADAMREVRRALLGLPDREMTILAMRFGIGDQDEREHTLDEIASEFRLSKERIRQIVGEQLERLRARLAMVA